LKIVWTNRAARNRSEQLLYIAEENPEAAVRLAFEIRDQVFLLSQYPEIGRSGKLKGSRELVIHRTPYVVIYRIRAGSIEIFRLMHGAQQWPPA